MTPQELAAFHADRRARTVTVTCEKSSVPMLWLDSSILIQCGKLNELEKPLAAKLSRLLDVVRSAVREGRLVCPEGEQGSEFEGRRLADKIRSVASSVSFGARAASPGRVTDQLVLRGLTAYIAGASVVHVLANDFLYTDPSRNVSEALQSGFIIDVETEPTAEWIASQDQSRQSLAAQLEAARASQRRGRVSFEEQLEIERRALAGVAQDAVLSYTFRTQSNSNIFSAALPYLIHMTLWKKLNGPESGKPLDALAGVVSFMNSPYFWELPSEDVRNRLFADLITGGQTVKSGDSSDIGHLALAIPVAHYVVTDKAMEDRCGRRGLGAKWETKILSSKGLSELCDEIEALKQGHAATAV